jgi:geranylgeranyl diphosphate synthase type I
MSLEKFIQKMLPAIEDELMKAVALANAPGLNQLTHMLAYHMGWEGEGAGAEARGKRLRPILTLLTTATAGGDWKCALPAAAAVELVHNFSLIHDDIEDNSPLRRGRPTIWTRWGIAQAINTGDALFTLAYLSITRLAETVSPQAALQASRILQNTCLQLTQGQFLDLCYEARDDLTLEAYWSMVSGKTAALLGACTEIGALTAGTADSNCASYRQFGIALGLAFQAQDDLLGIWGDEEVTGKSAESDLLSGKKSLPVLFGLSQGGAFAQRWSSGEITPNEIPGLVSMLEADGARAYTQEQIKLLTDKALNELEQSKPGGEAGSALKELAFGLLHRQG